MRKNLSILTLALACWSCGSLENHHVMTGAPHPVYGGDIRIVMENAPVPGAFEEVAIVQSVGTGNKAKLEPLISGLKKEAAQLGCDTIVRVRVDQGYDQATAVGVAGVVAAE